MNIETKTVRDSVYEYEKFGWKHTEDTSVRHGPTHHTEHVLARDKDMPNYQLITTLEQKYFSLRSRRLAYTPMDPMWGVVTFLLFIVPFVVYACVKNSQKKRVQTYNAYIQKQMSDILAEVKTLL